MEKSQETQQEKAIQEEIELLISKNGMERKKARAKLVKRGRPAINYLEKLIFNPQHIQRWEALKTMEEIGDPISIPFFIQSLEDDESDIRWIAAEGLIKLGTLSVKPLLEALLDKPNSIFILAGAHHVFYSLKKSNKLPANFPIDEILDALKHPKWMGSIKPMVYEIMSTLKL